MSTEAVQNARQPKLRRRIERATINASLPAGTDLQQLRLDWTFINSDPANHQRPNCVVRAVIEIHENATAGWGHVDVIARWDTQRATIDQMNGERDEWASCY